MDKIKFDDFAKRRQQLIQQMDENSIAIIPSASVKNRSSDTEYLFRQNSNFYYLTGFEEPDAVLVLIPGGKDGEFILYNRPHDPVIEQWQGARAGQEGAIAIYEADKSFPIEKFSEDLPQLLEGHETLYHVMRANDFTEQFLKSLTQLQHQARRGRRIPTRLVNVEPLLHQMRLVKSEAEISLMRKVANISAQAHKEAMATCVPGMYEYELDAIFLAALRRNGCSGPAYSNIIAAGKNACILHYITNNSQLKDGELVLIDIGGEYHNYAADISRTFPVNGRFNKNQQALYEVVLASQLAAIETIKPGARYDEAETIIRQILTQGLIDLGLLQGELNELIEQQAYQKFYMHSSGHWLGLDVHDVGTYRDEKGQWRTLQPNMIRTVEPGLYISEDAIDVAEEWRGIGVRIEDDILVTQTGCENLSADAPKTIQEIEDLMS